MNNRSSLHAFLVVVVIVLLAGVGVWYLRPRETKHESRVERAQPTASAQQQQRAVQHEEPPTSPHAWRAETQPAEETRPVQVRQATSEGEREARDAYAHSSARPRPPASPRHITLHATDDELAAAREESKPAVLRTYETVEEPEPLVADAYAGEAPRERDRRATGTLAYQPLVADTYVLVADDGAPLGSGPVTPDEPLAAGPMQNGKIPFKYYFDPNGERTPDAEPAIHWQDGVGRAPYIIHLGGTGMLKDPEGKVRRIESGYEVTFWVNPVGKKRVFFHLVSKDGKIGFPYNWPHGPGFTSKPSGHKLDFRKDGKIVPYDGGPD